MIDNPKQVERLLGSLNEHLPLAVAVSPELAALIRRQAPSANVPGQCQVTWVSYSGDSARDYRLPEAPRQAPSPWPVVAAFGDRCEQDGRKTPRRADKGSPWRRALGQASRPGRMPCASASGRCTPAGSGQRPSKPSTGACSYRAVPAKRHPSLRERERGSFAVATRAFTDLPLSCDRIFDAWY